MVPTPLDFFGIEIEMNTPYVFYEPAASDRIETEAASLERDLGCGDLK